MILPWLAARVCRSSAASNKPAERFETYNRLKEESTAESSREPWKCGYKAGPAAPC